MGRATRSALSCSACARVERASHDHPGLLASSQTVFSLNQAPSQAAVPTAPGPAVGLRVSRAISRAGVVMVVKQRTHLRVVRARAALGALDREAADAAVLDLLWRRSARSYSSPTPTRVSACISQAARRRSKTQPRARAGAKSREAVVHRLIARATKSRSRRARERDDPTASRRGCGVGCASDGRTPRCPD